MQRRHGIPGRFGAMIGAATMVLAACGSSSGGLYGTTPSGTPAASTAPGAGGADAVTVVMTSRTDAIGAFLVDKDGRTLYVLTSDTPGASTCAGGCATTWPPLVPTAGATIKGDTGVGGTFATITRADGSSQVTYNDAALYYYAGDAAAGDVNGQGLGGVWFVASPEGGPNAGPNASPGATKDANY